MAMTRALNPTLYTPLYDKCFWEGYNDKNLRTPALDALFTKMTDSSKQVDITALSDSLRLEPFDEMAPVPSDELREVYQKTFLHLEYGRGINVSFNAVKDEEGHAFLKQQSAFRKLGILARESIEYNLESLFAKCATLLSADNLPILDNAHPIKNPKTGAPTTFDNNLGVVAFNVDALEALENLIAEQAYNSRGEEIDILGQMRYLVHGPAISNRVSQVIGPHNEFYRPDSSNRTSNPLAGRYTSVCLPFLRGTAKYYWFLVGLDVADLGLAYIVREAPVTNMWVDNNLRSYKYEVTTRYSYGCYDPRAIWGALATS